MFTKAAVHDLFRSTRPELFHKVFLQISQTQRKTPVAEFRLLKKETPVQAFSCEFCEILRTSIDQFQCLHISSSRMYSFDLLPLTNFRGKKMQSGNEKDAFQNTFFSKYFTTKCNSSREIIF